MAEGELASLYNLLITGGNVRIARYPTQAVGVTCTASGKTTGAYKYAAANANSKQIVAKATFTNRFKIIGLAINTVSVLGIYTLRAGRGTAAADAAAVWLAEHQYEAVTLVGPGPAMVWLPLVVASVLADGTNDVVLADLASAQTGQDDTAVVSVAIATGITAP